MNKQDIVVLVPAYCPEPSMISMIKELHNSFDNIVVVNDGCDSSYSHIFDEVRPYAHIIVHESNKGKGRALKTGYEYIKDNYSNAKGVVTADADGQHTPSDIVKCCNAFLENESYAVFGCRDFASDTKIPPRSRFGNRLTSKLMKFFCDITLSDTQTGLRVISTSVLDKLIKVNGDRYEYEMNAVLRLKELDIPLKEVPIEIIYIDNNSSSHFNPIKDSFRIYKVFIKFCLSSFGSAILDLILFTLTCFLLNPDKKALISNDYVITYYVIIATVFARIFSGIFNFLINRWIFGNRSKVASSGLRYFVLWFFQMCCSAGIVAGLVCIIPIHETIIKIVIDMILFFISYKIQQKWVFKN